MPQSKIFLITGATAGIGRSTVGHLLSRGHRVIATGRRPQALEALRREHPGAQLDTVVLDVDDIPSIERAAAEVAALTGGHGVDVLVNNAGYGLVGPLLEISDDDLRAQYQTNVFGLMAVTRAFVPAMLTRGAGRVVNVSSIGGRFTFPFMGAYNSTKYAVESLSDALRAELAPLGVQVALVEPGPIRTEFSDRAMGLVERHKSQASRWAGVYANTAAVQGRVDATSVPPLAVARAIERAGIARRPRARYVVPGAARLLLALVALLPTRITDALLSRIIGLTSRNVRRGASPEQPMETRTAA